MRLLRQLIVSLVRATPGGRGVVVFVASNKKAQKLFGTGFGVQRMPEWVEMERELVRERGAVAVRYSIGLPGQAATGQELLEWSAEQMEAGAVPVLIVSPRGGMAEGLNPVVGAMSVVLFLGVPVPYVGSPAMRVHMRRSQQAAGTNSLVQVDMDAASVLEQAFGRVLRSDRHYAFVALVGDFGGRVKRYLSGPLLDACNQPALPSVTALLDAYAEFMRVRGEAGDAAGATAAAVVAGGAHGGDGGGGGSASTSGGGYQTEGIMVRGVMDGGPEGSAPLVPGMPSSGPRQPAVPVPSSAQQEAASPAACPAWGRLASSKAAAAATGSHAAAPEVAFLCAAETAVAAVSRGDYDTVRNEPAIDPSRVRPAACGSRPGICVALGGYAASCSVS